MVKLTGGTKLEKVLSGISKRASNAETVDIGFLADATYPDGTSVAMVAALNEFGHGNSIGAKLSRTKFAQWLGVEAQTAVPPRPFFRGMIRDKSPEWPDAVGDLLVANGYDATRTLEQTGAAIKGQLQEAITVYVGPPLAESTIARKGNDKQLIDTGTMLKSVAYRVK